MSEQSLQEYLAAKRSENQRKQSTRMTVPVPGYEERLAGRYKILDFETKRDIQQRHDNIGEQGDGVELVNASADLIVNACEDLLEITDPGDPEADPPVKASYQSLGKQWTAPDVAELFGAEITPGQGGTTAIQALKLVLTGEQIMTHFGRIRAESEAILAEAKAAAAGESQPSVEGSPT